MILSKKTSRSQPMAVSRRIEKDPISSTDMDALRKPECPVE